MAKKSAKQSPLLEIERPESTKKVSVMLKESNAKRIEDYRAFLSARSGDEVSLDAVLDALSKTLERDSLFVEWRATREKPSLFSK